MKNYYNILGVQDNASYETIVGAYKKLAPKFHPDKNANDAFFTNWFKEINEARQILTNHQKRQEYDSQLEAFTNAFELLQLQQQDVNYYHNFERGNYLQIRNKKQKWWIAAIVALFVACTLLILQDNDSKALAVNFRANVLSTENDMHLIETAVNNTKQASEKYPERKKLLSAVKHRDSLNEEISKEISRLPIEERELTEDEMNRIAESLNQLNSTYCVQIVQAANSNIKKNFSIAQYLSSNGYTIAGRSVKQMSLHGFKVVQIDECLQLLIGSFE